MAKGREENQGCRKVGYTGAFSHLDILQAPPQTHRFHSKSLTLSLGILYLSTSVLQLPPPAMPLILELLPVLSCSSFGLFSFYMCLLALTTTVPFWGCIFLYQNRSNGLLAGVSLQSLSLSLNQSAKVHSG